MPTWKEFAWAAFMYGAIGGDRDYQTLMSNPTFLNLLRTNPLSIADSDIQKNLIKGFLNRWKTRVENSLQSAQAIKQSIANLTNSLNALTGCLIGSVNFQQVVTISSQTKTIASIVEDCYYTLKHTGYRIGPTATAKLLHILQPRLFVMWDGAILKYFKRRNLGIRDSKQGYRCFLEKIHQTANQIIQDFNHQSLNPPVSSGQSPEDYLSIHLQYTPYKTMAKFLDEYYWVTVTNSVMVPPSWYP